MMPLHAVWLRAARNSHVFGAHYMTVHLCRASDPTISLCGERLDDYRYSLEFCFKNKLDTDNWPGEFVRFGVMLNKELEFCGDCRRQLADERHINRRWRNLIARRIAK
jgi:hypothetical protein